MLAELFTQYGALLGGDGRAVPAAPELTYRDFVALEEVAVESEETESFWNDVLEGISVTRLPRLPESGGSLQPGTNRGISPGNTPSRLVGEFQLALSPSKDPRGVAR